MGRHRLTRRGKVSAGVLASVVIAVAVVAGSWEDAGAQPVSIRRTFFRGWRYSVDSSAYHKLGPRASALREIMKDYRICISALNGYQSHVTAAKVTGLASGILIGLPLISQVRGKEWIDGYTPMVVVGGSLAVISVALEAAGSRHLKKAVMFYNRYKGYTQPGPNSPAESYDFKPRAGITIGLRF